MVADARVHERECQRGGVGGEEGGDKSISGGSKGEVRERDA